MENKQTNIVAAFDFDGTITTKDSLFQFIIHCVGWPAFFYGMLKFLPSAINYLAKNIDNNKAKAKLFSIFFKNMPFQSFQNYSFSFCKKINEMVDSKAMDKIDWHKKQGHELIIISASIKNWIEPWAFENGFSKVLATEAEVINGLLTGAFSSKNCHGNEKVARLTSEFPLKSDYLLYAYGDSSGDTALLKEADFAFYRKF
jgi:phosphatidylglycerophosphatase C